MTPITPETLTAALQWRYAVKKFDPTRKIPAETWSALEGALVLSPSSIGLQPWRFFVVTDPTLRAQLRPAAWDQSQVTECSHFVVFAVRKNLGAEHVDRHVARMAEVRGTTTEALSRFGQMALRNLDQARAEGRLDMWQTHQIYIALGSFVTAAAVLGVDTCAMEGFEPAKFDEILGLAGTDYSSVVACAAGYRDPNDKYAHTKKVRFKREDVIEER
ncbi:NAD(P)H-dependent oxidoreductase [Opitutus terrae]|uniref:Nitroreductase n=1 Tax=Opitutus terrae (strain DSM 11246 / JCM 15787 / PB90-1) TaxID=452637 RepID=B1ZYI6_OPITP|nr:NAD(P)H-dependent oxidoreductase [Opitutus terrae]ACB77084.1 nitroreductase [Opitutus terrae PB90-1]